MPGNVFWVDLQGKVLGLNDGAAVMLMASEKAISKQDLTPFFRIVSSAVVGVEPRVMGIGPVEASNKALKKAGLKMSDMDVIEINEAFSAQSLACIRNWGIDDNDPRINPNGGAIALGHPLGMSGTRILQTAGMEYSLVNGDNCDEVLQKAKKKIREEKLPYTLIVEKGLFDERH